MATTKLFFVTDVHGSDLCFRKFIAAAASAKKADVLVIGGDITAKLLVPVVEVAAGRFEVSFAGERHSFENSTEVRLYEQRLADVGVYTLRCDPHIAERLDSDADFAEASIRQVRIQRLVRWVEMVDRRFAHSSTRVFINPGNDDPFYIDDVLRASKRVTVPEGIAVELDDGVTMISSGFANRTPWNCPRDIDDDELGRHIASMMSVVRDPARCVFNLHAPPYGTALDVAVRIDATFQPKMSLGQEEVHVGSVAVRRAIEEWQPAVGLHGHIHERHAFERIGRTICFNPGSEYERGLLTGVYVEFSGGRVRRFGLTREHG